MTTANKITLTRIAMIPFFIYFAAQPMLNVEEYKVGIFSFPTCTLIALILFCVASFTDFLDGYLARKNNLVTDFGKFMDPLADKCLTTAAFIYMVACGICSPVVLAVILFREFAVAGVRMLAAETGTVIAANMWGKVKTVRFDRLGCFAYSAEENTVAAKMPNQIDEETKQRRADHIMELQAEVSAEREGEKVGHTYECICDGVDDETGMYLLRTKADCPEIDGNVLTPADTPLETGAFYNVTITDADTYDLYGYAEEKLED